MTSVSWGVQDGRQVQEPRRWGRGEGGHGEGGHGRVPNAGRLDGAPLLRLHEAALSSDGHLPSVSGEIEDFTGSLTGHLLWMDEISHHQRSRGNHCLLVFTRESSFQGFSGGAKWISSIHSIEAG